MTTLGWELHWQSSRVLYDVNRKQRRNYMKHPSSVAWASWCLKSPAYPLFVQQLIWFNNKENTQSSPLLAHREENPLVTGKKVLAMWKAYPCHDVLWTYMGPVQNGVTMRYLSSSNEHAWTSIRLCKYPCVDDTNINIHVDGFVQWVCGQFLAIEQLLCITTLSTVIWNNAIVRFKMKHQFEGIVWHWSLTHGLVTQCGDIDLCQH